MCSRAGVCVCVLYLNPTPHPPRPCGCRGRTRATRGRGERLHWELEVDTVGQRRGGWVQGGVIEPLQTSHLEQLNLGL